MTHHAVWGPDASGQDFDAVVIVDVLSFSTCVDVAVWRGAEVIPFRYRDERAAAEAERHGAVLAGTRSKTKPSLSPQSLTLLDPGSRLLLPSPNGSTLSLAFPGKPVFCACLRNAQAVGDAVAEFSRVLVVHAGEHNPDGTPRLAEEDMLGAGAVLDAIGGPMTLPATEIRDLFRSAKASLLDRLIACPSGLELIERGFPEDIEIAAALNVSDAVPRLEDGIYINQKSRR